MNNITTKVIIADDHPLFSDGLEQILSGSGQGFDILAKVNNGKALMQMLNSKKPDLILLDIMMPYLDGIHAATEIKKMYPNIKIIVISMMLEKNIKKKLESIGVEGYIGKDTQSLVLLENIKQVLGGKQCYYIEKEPACWDEAAPSIASHYKLSKREKQILLLIKDGLTTKQIANQLFLSEYTVETHRKNIITKSGTKSLSELIAFAHKV